MARVRRKRWFISGTTYRDAELRRRELGLKSHECLLLSMQSSSPRQVAGTDARNFRYPRVVDAQVWLNLRYPDLFVTTDPASGLRVEEMAEPNGSLEYLRAEVQRWREECEK